jgi:hypothetical protein
VFHERFVYGAMNPVSSEVNGVKFREASHGWRDQCLKDNLSSAAWRAVAKTERRDVKANFVSHKIT